MSRRSYRSCRGALASLAALGAVAASGCSGSTGATGSTTTSRSGPSSSTAASSAGSSTGSSSAAASTAASSAAASSAAASSAAASSAAASTAASSAQGSSATTDAGPSFAADGSADATTDAAPSCPSPSSSDGAAFAFGDTCPTGTSFDETFATDPASRWTVVAGTWTWDCVNSLYTTTPGGPQDMTWIGPRPSWGDYKMSAMVRVDTASGDGGFIFRVNDTGTGNPPPNNAGDMYYAGVLVNAVKFGIMQNGGYTEWNNVTAPVTAGTWHTLEVDVQGSAITVLVDGTSYLTQTDTTFPTGSIGLRTYSMGMSYGAISVTCL